MKKLFAVLTVLTVIGVSGFMMAGACEDVAAVCGDCGTVANGDTTISGNAELDGIFKAVSTLDMSTGSIQANFDGHVRTIAESVFDLNVEGKATADLVAEIETAFDAWIAANVEGGIKVNYQPPKCSANVDVSVKAQAQCEAKVDASCKADVECTPGSASFECSGKCEGSCTAECTVPTCTVKIEGSAECTGECKGTCTAEVNGSVGCEGTCQGECDGECAAYDGQGNCNGACSGNCNGSCVMEGSAAVDCSGSCSGECKVEGTAEAECTGSAGCSGECKGECSGGCEGEMTAPKCEGKAECNADASAKCEAQASAQASASLECTPPSLSIDVAFKAAATAEAKAEFMAKLNTFKAEMVGIVQGWAQLRGLVDADYAASIGATAPTVAIKASVDSFISALGKGEIEFEAEGLALCALPAFEDSAKILTALPGKMAGTLSAQVKMVALLNIN